MKRKSEAVIFAASTVAAAYYLALRVRAQQRKIFHLQRIATMRANRAELHQENLASFIDLAYHEVRLPLEGARIQLGMFRQGLTVENLRWAKDRSDAADVALGHMSIILRDLFDIARHEAGFLAPQVMVIDLATFLPPLLLRLAPTLETERVIVDVPKNAVAAGDYYQLERVVGNLVANGLKYSNDKDKVIVRVTRRSNEVILSIIDQGVGIAAGDLAHVFDRGYRGAAARNRVDGAGLGLYTVRLLVVAHGGRVWVESTPGAGSTFHVALPAPGASGPLTPIQSRNRVQTGG